MSPAIVLSEIRGGPLLRWGLVPSTANAGAWRRVLRPSRASDPEGSLYPAPSKDGVEPHLLKQQAEGEPSRRKIGARRRL
jgi:hypothetical protein